MKKQSFESSGFDTEEEAAFAANVAALVFDGPFAELNKVNLPLARKKEIEAQILNEIRAYLELPSAVKFGKFPQLYA